MELRKDTKKHPVARSVACYFCNEFFEDKYLQVLFPYFFYNRFKTIHFLESHNTM